MNTNCKKEKNSTSSKYFTWGYFV